jgi:hypothetical protein
MRLRRGAVSVDGAAIDRARLPLPRLPEADRQCIRAQHVDQKSCVEADHNLPKSFMLKAGSGNPHEVFFCRDCMTRLWSKYHAAPGDTLLVRAGTLDHPERVTPDVHIFTRSKLPWLELPPDARSFEAFYKLPEVWPAASQERLRRNIAGQA